MPDTVARGWNVSWLHWEQSQSSLWTAAHFLQVVVGSDQLCTLSSAQAATVTLGQRLWLGSAQCQALASAQHEGEAA